MAIDKKALLERFLEYVQIDSETGNEGAMAERLVEDFKAIGCEVTTDEIHEVAQTTGCNVYATLPGNPELEPLMFSAHMDTVVPGNGVKPRVDPDGFVRSDGTTVLGGDDKAGICAIMEAMKAVRDVEHRTVEAVITVREESGMYGAKNLDYSRIASKSCIVLDSSGGPDKIITAAPGQNKIRATITGRRAHAGLAPETGISAIQVAANAVASMQLLRIDEETTCNIGTFRAEGPTNVVSETAFVELEVRSRNNDKLEAHTKHLVGCLETACEKSGAKLECEVSTSYLGYSHPADHPLVVRVAEVVRAAGLEPELAASGGGSDANIYGNNGISAVNMGVGMCKVHTTSEEQNIAEMETASEVCFALMKA
ncbi:MAG: M20/M25/M40 family metallo-hydrolase [Oscillospiraceae bacterium]|nr:M20/M25/M40 family metallo-hydrolase [Oscillospiraceae bacterium]